MNSIEIKLKSIIRHILTRISIVAIVLSSCKKMVTVVPPYHQPSAENVFKDEATAVSALTGIYIKMSGTGIFSGNRNINMFTGLSSDEFKLNDGITDRSFNACYTNSLTSTDASNDFGSNFWMSLYELIYYCNSAIEMLNRTNSLSLAVKEQLFGEAKFLRAFFYFYVINLYGDAPVILTTDYKINSSIFRSSKDIVYNQIEEDLKDAKNLLSAEYLNGNLQKYSPSNLAERVRPTKWAAMSLLSRVYLFRLKYSDAENEASLVIGNSALYSLQSLSNVFLKNSQESIWQLQPVNVGGNTEDAKTFILSASTPPTTGGTVTRPVSLSSQILSSFEPNDQRRTAGNWVGVVTLSGTTYYFPFKYKNNTATLTEYLMVLRLGEQYLIRAEARARQNNLIGAIDDLDKIRGRAQIPLISTSNPTITQSALLEKIMQEKQVELFSEWGHRWLDLKRNGKVDEVMTVVTPLKSNGLIQWLSYQQWYPLPYSDIIANPNLTQNNGY